LRWSLVKSAVRWLKWNVVLWREPLNRDVNMEMIRSEEKERARARGMRGWEERLERLSSWMNLERMDVVERMEGFFGRVNRMGMGMGMGMTERLEKAHRIGELAHRRRRREDEELEQETETTRQIPLETTQTCLISLTPGSLLLLSVTFSFSFLFVRRFLLSRQ